MKKTILYIILSILVSCSYGQKNLKLVTKKHKNPYYTDKYYVLKNKPGIKHGEFKRLGYQNCLVEHGYYKNNLKDSLWTEYQWRSTSLKSKGEYKDDKQVGIWEYYNFQGKLLHKFNFQDSTVIDFNWYDDSDTIPVNINGEWQKMKVESPPLSLGNKHMDYILTNLKYPSMAAENGVSGRVIVAVTIDEKGQIINYRIEKSVSESLDKEALRVVKGINVKWIPAYIDNSPLVAEKLIPIAFVLQ
jgi:TonB family protein